ncbi:MAG: UDP-N-acetylmuramate--L-alanine ligase [Proteobacteria bacterium]|nr:UDP-N-acetylmuramate--L-alanine ligase [Pseudomonadota bacterium]
MKTILHNPAIKKVHFIGVGGIGMSGLAEILLTKGYQVSGSDKVNNAITSRLTRLGAQIFLGHEAEHSRDADAVVYSSAINFKNPEYVFAKQQGLPLIQRGELLAEIMSSGRGIAIAGTHGKTTTTGLAGLLLTVANLDPTYVIGGMLRGSESTVRIGKGPEIIAEADESDQSFLFIQPQVAIVTNIEADHLENYQWDFSCLKQAFIDFLNSVAPGGVAIVCIDDPTVREILPKISTRVITYGFSEQAQIRADQFQQLGLKSYFRLIRHGRNLADLAVLNLPGLHNVLNALAIVALAGEYQIGDQALLKALAEFPGMGRRFHPCGEITVKGGKALLFNDYGHHPTEIKATIAAARLAWPNRRLVMAFQPHRYSRTQALLDDFAQVLNETDLLFLLDIYAAGEAPISGVNGELLFQAVQRQSHLNAHFVPNLNDLPALLHSLLNDGDIVLLQGAGNIETLVKEIRAIAKMNCHCERACE